MLVLFPRLGSGPAVLYLTLVFLYFLFLFYFCFVSGGCRLSWPLGGVTVVRSCEDVATGGVHTFLCGLTSLKEGFVIIVTTCFAFLVAS